MPQKPAAASALLPPRCTQLHANAPLLLLLLAMTRAAAAGCLLLRIGASVGCAAVHGNPPAMSNCPPPPPFLQHFVTFPDSGDNSKVGTLIQGVGCSLRQ